VESSNQSATPKTGHKYGWKQSAILQGATCWKLLL